MFYWVSSKVNPMKWFYNILSKKNFFTTDISREGLDTTTDSHERCALHGKWSAYRLLLDRLKSIMASIVTAQKKMTAIEKQARKTEPVS